VTCGDIGIKPEQVEKVGFTSPRQSAFASYPNADMKKYLETVLLLGKIWGCGKPAFLYTPFTLSAACDFKF